MPDKNRIVCLLKESFLFGVLTEGELQEIVTDGRSSAAAYHAGESIYTDKSFKKALGTVISGRVSIYRAGNGSRVLLNKIEAGGIFGAASLFGASDLYVTGIFAETDAEIFFVSGELFEEIVSANQRFCSCLYPFSFGQNPFFESKNIGAFGIRRRAQICKIPFGMQKKSRSEYEAACFFSRNRTGVALPHDRQLYGERSD